MEARVARAGPRPGDIMKAVYGGHLWGLLPERRAEELAAAAMLPQKRAEYERPEPPSARHHLHISAVDQTSRTITFTSAVDLTPAPNG